jgi:hypothetical protein
VRERFPTEDQLAAEAGVCPVTHASGKSHGVVFRWACNKNLRLALTCFADNSRHACAWAAAIYQKARQRDLGLSGAGTETIRGVQARPRGGYPCPRLGTLAGWQTLRPSSPRRCRTHHLSQTMFLGSLQRLLAEALDAVLELRGHVEDLQAVELPKGFGRD